MPDEREKGRTLSRRVLLEAAAGTAVLFGLGVFASRWISPAQAHGGLVRPPGGWPEARFNALCVKCNRCEEICPQRVITSVPLRDGLLAARTPMLDFTRGYCDFCMKCVEVCPTRALQSVEKTHARIGVAVILQEHCIPWQWGGCTRCYEKCPEKAIRLDEQRRPIVDEAKCNGCGLCMRVCPATELRSYRTGQRRGVEIRARDAAR